MAEEGLRFAQGFERRERLLGMSHPIVQIREQRDSFRGILVLAGGQRRPRQCLPKLAGQQCCANESDLGLERFALLSECLVHRDCRCAVARGQRTSGGFERRKRACGGARLHCEHGEHDARANIKRSHERHPQIRKPSIAGRLGKGFFLSRPAAKRVLLPALAAASRLRENPLLAARRLRAS